MTEERYHNLYFLWLRKVELKTDEELTTHELKISIKDISYIET